MRDGFSTAFGAVFPAPYSRAKKPCMMLHGLGGFFGCTRSYKCGGYLSGLTSFYNSVGQYFNLIFNGNRVIII